VNRRAFGRDAEADLVDALRDGGHARLSLVAAAGDSGAVVGHILFSRLTVEDGDRVTEALALAPLAVLPGHQRRGIGSALVRDGLGACAALGHRIVIVLGEPEYYRRFGFRSELTRPLTSPFAGDAFMAVELVPGALAGVTGEVRYPAPFGAV
jgi:putative acetyltransferase